MRNFIREMVIKLASLNFPSIKFFEKILSLKIMTHEFKDIYTSRSYECREELWVEEVKRFTQNREFTFIEFGVWEGYSIKYLSEKFTNPKNRFFGFDSFEGLPENWHTMTGNMDAGHFSTGGFAPFSDDVRIKFIKGWFQNSVAPFITEFNLKNSYLVVHYDADLYSSTLHSLMQIDRLKTKYLAIFDEIPGDEARALYNYTQATGAKVSVVGRTGPSANYPWQIIAIIEPCVEYVV